MSAAWQKLIVGAYYGCEISPLSESGAIQPHTYFWWNGSGWVEGRLPRHLWKDHKECRRRYRYGVPVYIEQPLGQYDCETCRDDPMICASIPGLRHCEKATRAIAESAVAETEERK